MMTSSSPHPHYDVIVVGAGHAGCEAALAAARAGCTTLVLTPNLDRVGYMPCNPSIGGPGKSHLVAEVDALGGEMARAADRAALQLRLLNTSKGPAVQAIRAQEDKVLYAMAMKEALEGQDRLEVCQDEVLALRLSGTGALDDRPIVEGVITRSRGPIRATAVVITAGTFLRAAMIAGESRHSGGRAGDRADAELASSLGELGLKLRRLKTGTPPRVDARTVDLSVCEPQPGSEEPLWISRDGATGRIETLSLPPLAIYRHSGGDWRPQLACYRTGTNMATHDLIRANLDRAPMFNGGIEGIGPRYCPSVEDKVARFGDKASHPIFLEPEGWRTAELYVQGMSTSLPFDVQDAALRTIPALRDVRVTRYGYAVEYDAVDPSELAPTMESRRVERLFLAGQVNGTSGYEEAAGQGILAGLNAANAVQSRPQVALRRDQAYIGVMADDLSSKPFEEPYRMLTSRAEYRLSLRPGTADDRLASLAYDHGLIAHDRWQEIVAERNMLDGAIDALRATRLTPATATAEIVEDAGLASISRPLSAYELLSRPEVSIAEIADLLRRIGHRDLVLSPQLLVRIEEEVKYGAFIEREAREVSRRASLERRPLPQHIDYGSISGLRVEARQKLTTNRPRTFGEAGRLAGVTPADVAALLIHTTRLEAVAR
jgi:tRNA uridine 5-carboxymethylaminomethyl modification enzyme